MPQINHYKNDLGQLVKNLGLDVVNRNDLISSNLPESLDRVKRNLVVNYGEAGYHLPHADLVIFNPSDKRIIAILSTIGISREEIEQTAYWKLKLMAENFTKHIKVFLLTSEKDRYTEIPVIAAEDIDGVYKPTKLSDLINDIKKLKDESN